MDRRKFLRGAAGLGVALGSSLMKAFGRGPEIVPSAKVAFVKTTDRASGVKHAIDLLGVRNLHGKDIFIKPNFNSADATPGSTHNDTLAAVISKLKDLGAGPLTIGERSGMGNTRDILTRRGIFELAKEMDTKLIVLDELPGNDWEMIHHPDTHWQRGFAIPRLVRNASGIVTTCCLKTHRFGGHFTLSLKNSVGLVAKYVPADPYNYMNELHSSPYQRQMIAEINAAYKPELVVLDGVEAFTSGGPEAGKLVKANIVLASSDRIAIDAVGVAILRFFGTTPEVSNGDIFRLDQIARAVELNIGIKSSKQINLITDDRESAEYAIHIQNVLANIESEKRS